MMPTMDPEAPLIETLLPIALFVFSTSITPGPNNLMIMSSGLNHGASRSLPHLLGIWLGFPAMVIAVGLGLGSVFSQFPVLHEIIRWVGIGYLLYLAWLIASTREIDSASDRHPFSFFQAIAFQWVNPKGWIMAIGALAAFTSPNGEVWKDILQIALAFIAIGGPCVAVWLFFGIGLKRFLTKPNHLRLFNITMGLLLAASVVPLALEGLY
ncbi:LysE family translocator [Microbulbifer variabilis]|uniref:LysE family translocator n=1 Tax=Microbulbifer variabilis TaxID=266805 RepID=A0ABY4VHY2_9GAMM|nr:LysE family translocator [Microbulbifer variabilis]USD23001.1 LysE family translocator [Microbulbifer variabilis]